MKKLLGILLVGVFALSSCDNGDKPNCAQVKIVDQICGQYVLQVISGNLDGQLTDGWKSTYDGKVYDNVFSTYMPCEENLPTDPNDAFYVKAINEREEGNCMVCMAMLANAPETTIDVEVVPFCEADGLTD